MLIVMKPDATLEDIEQVSEIIEKLGYKPHPMPGASRTAIGITGNPGAIDPSHFRIVPGVADAIRVTKPFKLVSNDLKPEKSVIKVGTSEIGGSELAMIGGPCAVENRRTGIRGGPKLSQRPERSFFVAGHSSQEPLPTTSREKARMDLRFLQKCGSVSDLNIVTEAMDEHGVDLVEEYADCIQIGARNMQNFSLLKYVGRAKKPVLLKRGMSATLEEFLLAAEIHHERGKTMM